MSTQVKFQVSDLPKYPQSGNFVPTDLMRRAKATLISALQSGQVVQGSLGLLSSKELARLARQPQVLNWAAEPGFLAWFSDDSEALSTLAYLRMLALESAESILLDPDSKSAGAKVSLIKALLMMDTPSSEKEKPMTMDQLKKLVVENKALLLPLLQEENK